VLSVGDATDPGDGDAGSDDGDGDAGTSGAGASPSGADPEGAEGCACRTAPATGPETPWPTALIGAVAAARMLRRRRPGRPAPR